MKTISIKAGEIGIYPWGACVSVCLDVKESDLLDLLDEMEIDDIISYLEDRGYTVTKEQRL